MQQPLFFPLDALSALEVGFGTLEKATWQGSKALRLNGLAVLPNCHLLEGSLEVWIGADATCYPGIAFRVQDTRNFELAYVQPHTSGKWDALQYDPVFNGCNTWQLYHGPSYQKTAEVPLGKWFKLRLDFKGLQAAVWLDDQKPLVVRQLAHPLQGGSVGIWSYLPAYYRDLRLSPKAELPSVPGIKPRLPRGAVTSWEADGVGTLTCEPGGYLNLNRYLPVETSQVTLRKHFTTQQAGGLALAFGFSDELVLTLDGKQVYSGDHLWKPSSEWKERGYVDIRHAKLNVELPAGEHELVAALRRKEYFGWGIILKMQLTG